MSTWPLVKFVDSPDPTAAVRYDFNDRTALAERWVASRGFTLGSPTLEGDPDAVGQSFGFRQPLIPQRIRGSKQDALLALSSLSRELVRRTNWLLVQLDAATAPVWFKIYRSGYAALSLEQVYVEKESGDPVPLPDTWQIEVPLLAEAFAYGERVEYGPVTVTQSPTGTHAMRIVLPEIKGDAPTGLRISITPDDAALDNRCAWLVGCVSAVDTVTDPVVNIGTSDGFTAGTGTASPQTGTGYFSGDYRRVDIIADSGTTPNPTSLTGSGAFAERLSGTLPVVPAGRYKVLLRNDVEGGTGIPSGVTSVPDATQAYLFAFGQDIEGDTTVYGDVQTLVVSGDPGEWRQGWVDLGEFTFPFALDVPPDVEADMPAGDFSLKIGTTFNDDSTVRMDAFKLIPVDGPGIISAQMLEVTYQRTPLADGLTGTFDADTEAYWSTLDDEFREGAPTLQGGFPTADPTAGENVVFVIATGSGLGGGTAGGATYITGQGADADVTISYHPRFLHIGDGVS